MQENIWISNTVCHENSSDTEMLTAVCVTGCCLQQNRDEDLQFVGQPSDAEQKQKHL